MSTLGNRGGKKTGGRLKGTPNRVTADIKMLAQMHGPDIIARLAHLAFKAENEMAQISACKELLDRGYGRAVQAVQSVDGAGNPANTTMRVIVELVGDTAPQQAVDRRAGPRLIDLGKNVQLVG